MRLLGLSTLAMAFTAVLALPAPAPAPAPVPQTGIAATCAEATRQLMNVLFLLVGSSFPVADEVS